MIFGVLSGILIGTSWIPFWPWALAFSLAPVWYFILVKAKKPSQTFVAGWFTQFTLTMIGFYWVAYTAKEFGRFPWPAAVVTLFIFAALMHIYIPMAFWISHKLREKLNLSETGMIFSLALFTALFETLWPSIFPWNMGYPLYWAHLPWAQWADTIGFQGLSASVYLLNAVILWIFLQKDRKTQVTAGALVGIFLAITAYFGHLKKVRWSETDRSLKVLAIQANIGNQEKVYAEKGLAFQQEIIDQFFSLTRKALEKHPDSELIVWPESAFPDVLNDYALGRKYPGQFVRFSQSIQKPILTGAYSKDPPETEKRRDYNGIFLFGPNGQPLAPPYHKSILLIFGETIPFVETFPWLAKINPGGEGFGRGPGPSVMDFEDLKFGLQVCYESLYPQFSTGLQSLEANLLFNVTNDSWFGPHTEPYQHMIMTLARSIEIRRPMIRSTNTGISTVSLANGDILEQSPIGKPWFGQFEVKFKKTSRPTLYRFFAPWLAPLLLLALAGTLFLCRRGRPS